MTALDLFTTSSIIIAVQTAATFFLKIILENKIKKEVEHQYKIREQAAIVASLFAEWIDNPKEVKELNRLSWEATLWLPDQIAERINARLTNAASAPDVRKILIEAKELIHGSRSTLRPENIVFFQNQRA